MAQCSICAREFEAQFRFQVSEGKSGVTYYCSQACQQEGMRGEHTCTVCARPFRLEYPFQVVAGDAGPRYFCSPHCRAQAPAERAPAAMKQPSCRRIAVFNHKGGTGKTTTSVNLAAGLAERGLRVLLVDADGQGNVGASLGIRGERSLYHILVHGTDPAEAAVPVRQNLDVITANETLAAAELHLAQRPNRARILRERLIAVSHGYDAVVVDCAPALSLMNQNALVFADAVIVPVACDYLSLVGVKQVLRTLKSVHQHLAHDVSILGVLPTFFDIRNGISREAKDALEKHFGERCLPPIRVNVKLREAPSVKQTIFELAPESHGAEDYLKVVEAIVHRQVQRDEPQATGASTPAPAFTPPTHRQTA